MRMKMRKTVLRNSLWLLAGLLILNACSKPEPFPRPTGWPRIELPEHTYQEYSNPLCPFTMEIPAIGEVERQRDDSCWADFYFPRFDCRWHITYRNIPESGKTYGEHYEEYRKLVFKHIQKVSQIQDTPVENPNGSGTMFELYGTVAVPAQMIYGDSTHLLMISFYFDNAIRDDSLSPVINFMKEDLRHMAQSIRWNY